MAKNLALSLFWCRFHLWSWNFCMLQVQPKKKKQKKKQKKFCQQRTFVWLAGYSWQVPTLITLLHRELQWEIRWGMQGQIDKCEQETGGSLGL